MELIDKLEKNIDALANELQTLRKENNELRENGTISLSTGLQSPEHAQSLAIDESVKKEALSRIDNLLSSVQERLTYRNTSR